MVLNCVHQLLLGGCTEEPITMHCLFCVIGTKPASEWVCVWKGWVAAPPTPLPVAALVKYGGRSPKFIWALCHVTCTAVLIG
jgi:hypothetical protein